MRKVLFFSFLLILGLFISQVLPFGDEGTKKEIEFFIKSATLVFLAFIMIHVGIEFTIDRSRLKSYGWDYFVAFTAATLPWIFCAFYFVYSFQHNPNVSSFAIWTDALLLARFASPTSAGVLFSMMAAAGLELTWVFKKARILAIFDDLDTIILLIPIKMLIIGFRWEAIILVFVIGGLIYFAWKKMHSIHLPFTWPWISLYAILLSVVCEGVYFGTAQIENILPLQIEILLPAFVLGCVIAHPKNIHEYFEKHGEKIAKTGVAAIFIFFVGLSMPGIDFSEISNYRIGGFTLGKIGWHVLMLTLLSNLGKMFPLFCYRKEVSLRERFALSIALCPRGEVGAGVIIVSLALIANIDKALIVIAMLSLALNLILTGFFILAIKKLLSCEKKPSHPCS